MEIFIHQTHLRLLQPNKLSESEVYNAQLDLEINPLKYNLLKDNCIIFHPTPKDTLDIVQLLVQDKLDGIKRLTLVSLQKDDLKRHIMAQFKILEAAGGLVQKDDKYLLIYRLEAWDLPKGKRDEGETLRQTALREVEEECSIKASLGQHLTNTWHFYLMGKDKIPTLKKTKWYLMQCVDDSKMRPQTTEDISDIAWFSPAEVEVRLAHSYPAIRWVWAVGRVAQFVSYTA